MFVEMGNTQNSTLPLSALSSVILSIIRAKQTTTFSEVADLVIQNYNTNIDNGNDKTTRRRVYDVLNVFLAAGLIIKESKNIHIVHSQNSKASMVPDEDKQLYSKCEQLRESVIRKLKAYLLYRSLIERNQSKNRPSGSIQLPAIFIEFPNDKGVSELSLDQKTLEINAEQHPSFYSPVDVLSNINLSIDSQRELVRKTPLISKLEPFVFPEMIQSYNSQNLKYHIINSSAPQRTDASYDNSNYY